jgi:hypothetical protein
LIAAKFIQDKSLLQLYHAVQWLYPFTTIYYFLSEVFQHISCTFYCFWDIRRTKRINAEFFYFYFKFNGLKFNRWLYVKMDKIMFSTELTHNCAWITTGERYRLGWASSLKL